MGRRYCGRPTTYKSSDPIQFGLVAIAYFDATSPSVAEMTRGIFDVEGWKRIMLVTAICLLLSWSAMILCRIILAYGPERFGFMRFRRCR